jgi:hypothetical protein
MQIPELQWVNTKLGNIKNAMQDTYHQASAKHLPRYLGELWYRFNRRFKLAAMIPPGLDGLQYIHRPAAPAPYIG